jgi:hypothetical protein
MKSVLFTLLTLMAVQSNAQKVWGTNLYLLGGIGRKETFSDAGPSINLGVNVERKFTSFYVQGGVEFYPIVSSVTNYIGLYGGSATTVDIAVAPIVGGGYRLQKGKLLLKAGSDLGYWINLSGGSAFSIIPQVAIGSNNDKGKGIGGLIKYGFAVSNDLLYDPYFIGAGLWIHL